MKKIFLSTLLVATTGVTILTVNAPSYAGWNIFGKVEKVKNLNSLQRVNNGNRLHQGLSNVPKKNPQKLRKRLQSTYNNVQNIKDTGERAKGIYDVLKNQEGEDRRNRRN